ncbi:hypothetical protein T10_13140 [Trichinella papuae]|uniref:Uncharacterized protein n=1 Tax=Trichinella papuae TaxID=268474 RepID=A0A0V1LZ64_9BILA|nr:hypothetical protein T10_13140 [Trichinella papuae]
MNGICSVYFCVNYRANGVRRMNNGVFNAMTDEEYNEEYKK